MFRITYQARVFLQMGQMTWKEWQQCLRQAAPIVDKLRKILRDVENNSYEAWISDSGYQQYLADEELKAEREGKHDLAIALHDPNNAAETLKEYAKWLKNTLPGACFQAGDFAVSIGTKKYNKGKRGRWREMRYAYLNGLVVIDVDHCGNPVDLFTRISKEHSLKDLGIVLVYVSARGEGLKIVFKAREEWSNLICQQYEMASLLGILDYVDDACKDSSRLSWLTGPDDVLYCDSMELFNVEPIKE